jgi:hypothetical protein
MSPDGFPPATDDGRPAGAPAGHGRLSHPSADEVEADAARTVDPALFDVARRRGVVASAGHAGDEATIRAHLADQAATVRATAFAALARAGQAHAGDGAAAASDPAAEVRRQACELVGSLPGVDYLALLSDPDASVVEAAAFALGEVGDADAGAGAVEALSAVARSHADPLCRESAVAALGAIGSEAGLPTILAALDDRPAVRRRAALALAPFDGDEVQAALERCLMDHDWQVRQAAEDLLRPDR